MASFKKDWLKTVRDQNLKWHHIPKSPEKESEYITRIVSNSEYLLIASPFHLPRFLGKENKIKLPLGYRTTINQNNILAILSCCTIYLLSRVHLYSSFLYFPLPPASQSKTKLTLFWFSSLCAYLWKDLEA